MDIRFLESLIQVVDTGSIAAAGRVQGLTATAISQRVRTLEDDFGIKLLSRSAHSAFPTAACLDLLPRARRLVDEGRLLKTDIDPTGLSGNFRLGAISTALYDFVPEIVRRFAHNAPKANLTIIPGTSAMLYEMMLSDELDGALTVAPAFSVQKHLKTKTICRQPLVLVHSCEDTKTAREILSSHPLIVYDRKSWGGNIAWNWVMRTAAQHRILCELDSLETIATLVEQKLGVSVVPLWRGLKEQHPSLCQVDLDTENFTRDIIFMSPRSSRAEKLVNLVETTIGEEVHKPNTEGVKSGL